MCGNYSREETIQGRKLYEEIRYPGNYVFTISKNQNKIEATYSDLKTR